MLIDLADGISRYVAAAFDVSTGDVVEIITFALTAVFLEQKAAVWAAGMGPHVGFIVSMVILAIKGLTARADKDLFDHVRRGVIAAGSQDTSYQLAHHNLSACDDDVGGA